MNKNLNRITVFIAVFLLAFTVACAPLEVPQEPQEPVEDTTPEPAPPVQEEEPEPEPLPPEPEMKEPNQEILSLVDKGDKVKSYAFLAAEHGFEYGETRTDVIGTYWVRGNLAKVEIAGTEFMDGWSADYVFVDFEAETAQGYCLEMSCQTEELKGEVDFSDYDIKLPTEWFDILQYGEIVGQQQYNDRPVIVVEGEDDGNYFEAFIDTFYGFPMRVIITTDEERTNIIAGIDYRAFEYNTVDEEEVMPPY